MAETLQQVVKKHNRRGGQNNLTSPDLSSDYDHIETEKILTSPSKYDELKLDAASSFEDTKKDALTAPVIADRTASEGADAPTKQDLASTVVGEEDMSSEEDDSSTDDDADFVTAVKACGVGVVDLISMVSALRDKIKSVQIESSEKSVTIEGLTAYCERFTSELMDIAANKDGKSAVVEVVVLKSIIEKHRDLIIDETDSDPCYWLKD